MSILVFMSFYFGWLKNFFKWQTLSFFSPRKFFKIPDMISLSLPKTGFFIRKMSIFMLIISLLIISSEAKQSLQNQHR